MYTHVSFGLAHLGLQGSNYRSGFPDQLDPVEIAAGSMFIDISRKVQRSKCHFFNIPYFYGKKNNSDINIDSMASPLLRICLWEKATDHG